MADGQQADFGQGSVALGNRSIPVRSRKPVAGAATFPLSGVSSSVGQGSIGDSRSKALTGSAVTSVGGSLTPANANPTWQTIVPDISFPQGTSGTHDLTQYTQNVNTNLHEFALASGSAALPSGVTLPSTGVLTYNGTGSTATSSGVIFEIKDKTPVLSAESDFITRRSSPGVVRWFDFNTTSQLGGGFGANFGNFIQGSDPAPVIDTAIKASGAGSMLFNHGPSLGGALWWTNVSSDLSKLYGAGESIYFQFRYRVSQEIANDYAAKIFLFGTGDTPGTWQSSCTDLEVELNADIFGRKWLAAYNACPGSCGANTVFTFANANPGGHRFLAPNQWMTIQCGVTIGPLETHGGHDWFVGSNVKIWIQYGTDPEILLFNWTGGPGGTPGSTPTDDPPCWGLCARHDDEPGQKYGKLWLTPYNQELDSGALPGKIWYDDLIIGTQKIPAVLA